MRIATTFLVTMLLLGRHDPATVTITMHGRPQTMHVYGTPGGPTAIVSSGDGGWIHLAPHIATMLAARGWYVIGFDARAYLSSAGTPAAPLLVRDIPHDYTALVARAATSGRSQPVLIGVSEGAGLSVAAAAGPELKSQVSGVVAIGLGDRNELAWHMRDAIIYLTKGTPNEPLFHATDVARLVAPIPFAMLRPSVDEFVPREESDRVFQSAAEPKMLRTVAAADHRFSNNLDAFDAQLVAALAWMRK